MKLNSVLIHRGFNRLCVSFLLVAFALPLLLAISVSASVSPASPPTIVASKTYKVNDNTTLGGNAKQGDTLNYTVVITNTGSGDATGVTFNDTLDANTTLVPGSLTSSPVAVNDVYTATGNIAIFFAAPGVLANDYLGLNPPATLTISDTTSANGGAVNVAADGSFTYNPPAAFTGTDTFHYTLSNVNGSSIGTVTITVSDRILFVSPSGSGAACKSAAPCTLAQAGNTVAVTSGKDLVFVESGTYNGAAITLKSGQTLAGQQISITQALADAGITLAPNSQALSFPASTIPVLNGGGNVVTLNSNNLVEALAINPSGGSGVFGNSITSGTTTVRNLTITATGSANGVNLTSNTGGTFSFSNIVIAAASGTGFNATGGGTVNVTQNNSSTVNTLSTTTGTALYITYTNIGPSGLTFRSISANGATNGIVLTSTGSSGGLTVTGNGSTGTGGTIQNTTGHGITVANVGGGVSLAYMNITNPGMTGIQAAPVGWTYGVNTTSLGVSNLTVDHVQISDNAGNVSLDDGITVENASGNVSITNSSISAARHQGITIDNYNTSMASLTLQATTVTGTPGGDGALIQMRGNSVMTNGTIGGATPALGNTFSNNSATGLQVNNADSGNIASLNVQNNTVSGNNAGMDFDLSQSSSMTILVQNNTFNNHRSNALNLVQSTSSTSGSMTATLRSNNIGTLGVVDSGSAIGNGIRVANGGVTINLTIDSNVIREVPNGRGIDIEPQAYTANANVKTKIVNNQIIRPTGTNQNIGCGANTPCPSASIFVLSDSNNLGGFEHQCMVITGNTAYDPTSWPLGGEAAFYFARRTSPSNTMQLEGTNGDVVSQILATNTVTNFTSADVFDENTSGPVTIVPAGTCGGFPAFLAPNSNQRIAQNNLPGATGDLRAANILLSSARFNAPLVLSNWLKPAEVESKVSPFGCNLAPASPAPIDLRTLFAPLTDFLTARTALAAPVEKPMGAAVSTTAGTLNLGKSVTIKFKVTVNKPLPSGTTSVSNQGTVSGSNFTSVLTDDPSVGGTSDPTVTPLDMPDLTVAKTNDVGGTVPLGASWSWKLSVANTGKDAATFSTGQVILTDTLPITATYGTATITSTNMIGTVSCSVSGSGLGCVATSVTATLGAVTGTLQVTLPVTPTSAGTFTNPANVGSGGMCKVDPGGLISESNISNNTCSDTVTVVAPPIVTKSFADASISSGGVTTMMITITNPVTNTVALTGVAITDAFPAGLQVATPPAASNTCGGSWTASAGAANVSLAGGSVDVSGSCSLSVRVTGTTPGYVSNTTGAVTSTNGGSGNTATANLTVVNPPVMSKRFGASSMALGMTTSLTFSITNTNPSIILNGLTFTDNLPPGMVVATPNHLTGSCGGGTITATAGTASVSLSGASLTGGTSCSFSLDVQGTIAASMFNATSGITSTDGGTGNPATANITISQGATIVALSATPATTVFGETVYLTATVTASIAGPAAPSGGTVQFYDNGIPLGAPVALTGDKAFLNTSVLGVGTHSNLTATYSGDANFASGTSPASTHIVNPAPTVVTIIDHQPNPSLYNQAIIFAITVTSPYGTPSGTVTLNEGASQLATGTLSGGVVTFSVSSLAVGTHTIVANYLTDGSFASGTSLSVQQQVDPASTTTTIASSKSPTVYGEPVTFTAMVTSTQGTPTGTATFYSDGASLGTVGLGSGAATFTASTLAVAPSHTITVVYSGSTNFAASTSADISQAVNKANTGTTLSAATTNPTYGQSVTFTATVSAIAPGAGLPTGSVTLYDGLDTLFTGALNAGGMVTFTVNTLSVNSGSPHSIAAVYGGESRFNASSSSPAVAVTVARAPLTVTADPKTKSYGDPLPPLSATITGYVLGENQSAISGAPALSTSALASSPVVASGYPITVMPGTLTAANYSFTLVNGTLTVTPVNLLVTANNKSKLYGAPNPTLDASITGFVNGDLASALSGAPALTTTAVQTSPVATYPITVTQGTLANVDPAHLNYTFSFANGTLTVNPDATTTTLATSGPNPSIYGQTVLFTATVISTQGQIPVGTVTFKDGATTIATVGLNASGIAAYSASTLAVASSPHSMTAAYNGNSNMNASVSSPVIGQVVNQAATTTTIVADTPNPSNAGQVVTVAYTVTVNSPGKGMPTGNVTVSDGTSSCTGTVAAGSCQLVLSTSGLKNLMATYAGDGNFATSTSVAVAHTVTLTSCVPTPPHTSASRSEQSGGILNYFLPFIANGRGAEPDLIVQSITPTTNTLQIVIANQGGMPVTADFWVDLYINPNPLPKQVNQIWQSLSNQGAVWGVTASALPIAPSSTRTLTVGDAYYVFALSNLPASLPAGTCVFAQVDSANASTTYGAVLENHEILNGPYNNITGIQLGAPAPIAAPRSGTSSNSTSSGRFPPRPAGH